MSEARKPWHTAEYTAYLHSFAWKSKRNRILKRAAGRCEYCRTHTNRLQVHHRHYDTLFREQDHDLMAVCSDCHGYLDSMRQEHALYNARLDGWASKKYGENWELYDDPARIEEEFDDWLERREQW